MSLSNSDICSKFEDVKMFNVNIDALRRHKENKVLALALRCQAVRSHGKTNTKSLPPGFEIKESVIIEKGALNKGVFATEAIPEGGIIGEYTGNVRVQKRKIKLHRKDKCYNMTVSALFKVKPTNKNKARIIIDATDNKQSSFIRYINSVTGKNKNSVKEAMNQYYNIEFDEVRDRVYAYAHKPIAKGAELVSDYMVASKHLPIKV